MRTLYILSLEKAILVKIRKYNITRGSQKKNSVKSPLLSGFRKATFIPVGSDQKQYFLVDYKSLQLSDRDCH